jgi:hypothetical protein
MFPSCTTHNFFTERYCCSLASFFVNDADLMPFFIIKEGAVNSYSDSASRNFDRGSEINKVRIRAKKYIKLVWANNLVFVV